MMKKAIPLLLVGLAILLLVWGITRDSNEESTLETSRVAVDEGAVPLQGSVEPTDGSTQPLVIPAEGPGEADEITETDAVAVEEPKPRRELINIYDEEEEREARQQVAREIFGEDGPVMCDNACDCEPGSGCQQPAGICVPGLMDIPCCDWDECPPGQACVSTEARQGLCPGSE